MLFLDWMDRQPNMLYDLNHITTATLEPHEKTVIAKTLFRSDYSNFTKVCTALFFSLFAKSSWMKIDCNLHLDSSSFLCEKKRVNYKRVQNSIASVTRNEYFCSSRFVFYRNKCLQISTKHFVSTLELMNVNKLMFQEFLTAWGVGNSSRNIVKYTQYNGRNGSDSSCFVTDSLSHQSMRAWVPRACQEKDTVNVFHIKPVLKFTFICDTNKYFTCKDSTCILSHYICDGETDCEDGSDESNCTDKCYNTNINCTNNCYLSPCKCEPFYFRCIMGKCVPFTMRCNGISECPDSSDELSCVYIDTFTQINNDTNLEFVDSVPCPDDHSKCNASENTYCYPTHKWCIYETDSLCPYLEHLNHCSLYECPTMFKCIKSYCIPLYRVCDGTPDCPSGDDEHYLCSKLACVGMLKCRADHLCVHPDNICDGIINCALSKDDEALCIELNCPLGCECRGQIINCTTIDMQSAQFNDNIKGLILVNVSFFAQTTLDVMANLLFLSITQSTFSSHTLHHNFLDGLIYLQELDLSHCFIKFVAVGSFSMLQNIVLLDITGNDIHAIHSDTFQGLINVMTLDFSFMHVTNLQYCSFCDLRSMYLLNLSYCNMKSISYGSLHGMPLLLEVDLRGNPLVHVDNSIFITVSIIILVSEPCLCCYTSQQMTCLKINSYTVHTELCHNILKTSQSININLILSSVVLFGNIACLVLQHFQQINAVHKMLCHHQTITAILMIIYATAISTSATLYTEDHIYRVKNWQRSFACQLLNICFVCSIFLSKYTTFLMAFNKLLVTKYALVYKPLNRKDSIVGILIGWISICVYIIIYRWAIFDSYGEMCIVATIDRMLLNGVAMYFTAGFLFLNLTMTVSVALIFNTIIRHVKFSAKKTGISTKNRRIHSALFKHAVLNVVIEVAASVLYFNVLVLQMSTSVSNVNNLLTLLSVHILASMHFLPLLVKLIRVKGLLVIQIVSR